MTANRLIALPVACMIFLSSLAIPPASGAVIVHPKSQATHGTLVNRHVLHTRFAAKPAGVKRAVVRTAKPTVVHRRVTRARRSAKVHHGRHRTGGVMGHVYNSAGDPVANAQVVTDNAGHFVLRGVAAGGHRLVASKSGAGKASKTVHIKGGATRTGVQIKLAAAHPKHKKHHHHKKA